MKSVKTNNKEYIAVTQKNKRYKIIEPFNDEVKINQLKTEIKVLEENGFTYILYNNKKYLAEIIEKNQNKYTVLINGVSYSFTIESPFSFERKKFLEAQGPKNTVEQVIAPMPGKIVEILCEEGKEIKEGESVLILEAMKMQNEINAPIGGKVKHIHVKANDTVNKDDVLVEIAI